MVCKLGVASCKLGVGSCKLWEASIAAMPWEQDIDGSTSQSQSLPEQVTGVKAM